MEQFFDIPGGKIQNLTETERTKLAQKNIILAATGSRTNPNYVIADRGEGQTPKEMPHTILSINKSNKLKVPFVQGKFNMGGTGVLDFCGEENLQLIISKRCPDISEDDPTHDFWGFTIIRRELPFTGSGRKSSKYTYLVNQDQEVMSFDSAYMPIIPSSSGEKDSMDYGMYCKLYNYNLSGSGMKSNINMGLNTRLSLLLPNLAYPIFLDECRAYEAHTLNRTLSGLCVRLYDQMGKGDSIIEEKATANFMIPGQKIAVETYVFESKKKLDSYRKNEGVLVAQNGQTHATESKRFYSNKAVGMSYLADCLLTIVDCSEVDEITREDLFMNSRDRLRSSDFTNKLKSELRTFLKENETLKQLQAQRRENDMKDKLDDEKPLEDVLSNVLNNSPVLSSLFLSGERLKNPVNLNPRAEAETFNGKYNPTYFTLIRPKSNSTPIYCREVQLDRKFRIQFKTDACNDFFRRDKYPGQFTLERGKATIEDYFINLHDGTATLNVDLPENAEVGDEYSYSYIVIDTNNENNFTGEFQIFVAEKQNTPGANGRRTPPSSKEKGHDTLNPAGIELPNVIEVVHDDWEDHDFDRESALAAYCNEDSIYDFYVNMENIHLLTELKNVSKDEAAMKLLKARYKYSMVLIGLSILGYEKTHWDSEDNTKSEIEDPEETIRLVTRMVSPVILPMINDLGNLDESLN